MSLRLQSNSFSSLWWPSILIMKKQRLQILDLSADAAQASTFGSSSLCKDDTILSVYKAICKLVTYFFPSSSKENSNDTFLRSAGYSGVL